MMVPRVARVRAEDGERLRQTSIPGERRERVRRQRDADAVAVLCEGELHSLSLSPSVAVALLLGAKRCDKGFQGV